MRDWMDFDGDGEVDSCERMFAEEILCTSKEEHEALFGDAGDFDDDMEDDLYCEKLVQDYMDNPDPEKTETVTLEELAKREGISL